MDSMPRIGPLLCTRVQYGVGIRLVFSTILCGVSLGPVRKKKTTAVFPDGAQVVPPPTPQFQCCPIAWRTMIYANGRFFLAPKPPRSLPNIEIGGEGGGRYETREYTRAVSFFLRTGVECKLFR